ncbi:MAG TPA: hypothetical protein VJ438_00910 [Candidatus Nanoarchaeia archaeon]|nr:hypothetical protein [Candidatus Nanoarchaeia archaeon]
MKKEELIRKQKATLSLNPEIYKRFKEYCEENAFMLSKKVENFMKGELDWKENGTERRRKKK